MVSLPSADRRRVHGDEETMGSDSDTYCTEGGIGKDHAVAGGLELAIWCDLRIAGRNATFGVFCRCR